MRICTGVDLDVAFRLRVTPPPWLLKKSWDLQVSMAYSGWKTCFRQYVMVPDDAEVIVVVEDGTFEKLLELFNDGAASPFSVDTEGRTLLHVSWIYLAPTYSP